jgi:2-keto-3-deoxy-L-rhamnonate aldolase RhmA
MRGEQIRKKLHSGERIYGSHVCSLTNPVTAKIATQCDFDFVFICTEHMPLDRTETAMMCQFWAAHGVSPIVRIPCPDPYRACMALDSGAQGIVVPYIEREDEVLQLVGAVKYRPIKGKFLHDILTGQRQPKESTQKFLDDFNHDNYVIIGVESVEAVRNIEVLVSVPGVDGVFIGPHDLTVSMEIPTQYEHPEFIDAVESVIRCCRRHNVGVGLHYQLLKLDPDTLRRFLDAGMNWLINGADAVISRSEMNYQLTELRSRSGDTFQREVLTELQINGCIESATRTVPSETCTR